MSLISEAPDMIATGKIVALNLGEVAMGKMHAPFDVNVHLGLRLVTCPVIIGYKSNMKLMINSQALSASAVVNNGLPWSG